MLRTTVSGHGPMQGPPALRVPCRKCQAQVGERCRVYRMERGERLYERGHRQKFHAERIADAKGDAE